MATALRGHASAYPFEQIIGRTEVSARMAMQSRGHATRLTQGGKQRSVGVRKTPIIAERTVTEMLAPFPQVSLWRLPDPQVGQIFRESEHLQEQAMHLLMSREFSFKF